MKSLPSYFLLKVKKIAPLHLPSSWQALIRVDARLTMRAVGAVSERQLQEAEMRVDYYRDVLSFLEAIIRTQKI